MKQLKFTAAFLHCFIGIGAAAGGFAGVINPVNPFGIPLDALSHSPFNSFLHPSDDLRFLIFRFQVKRSRKAI